MISRINACYGHDQRIRETTETRRRGRERDGERNKKNTEKARNREKPPEKGNKMVKFTFGVRNISLDSFITYQNYYTGIIFSQSRLKVIGF